jgi:glycerophosphoryl diester phosphodiesterase
MPDAFRPAAPVHVSVEGRRAALKWHRARRMRADAAFTRSRLREAMHAGASVEIDLNPMADGGFAVIHDATLERETTGSGRVADATAADLAPLLRRANDGRPIAEPVQTLAALVADLAGQETGAGALLQLDLKCGDADLTPAHVARFAQDAAPLAAHLILSGGDAAAVRRLARACGVAVGYDPCHEDSHLSLARSGRFDDFVRTGLAAMPEARIVYLDLRLVAAADAAGMNLIAPFREDGRGVDAYTIADTGPAMVALARRAILLGADQITTDDPQALHAALASP